MPINQPLVHETILETTELLLGKGLTGEEYLLTLQTLVAQALACNDHKVKKIFLLNLNADTLARRKAIMLAAAEQSKHATSQ